MSTSAFRATVAPNGATVHARCGQTIGTVTRSTMVRAPWWLATHDGITVGRTTRQDAVRHLVVQHLPRCTG